MSVIIEITEKDGAVVSSLPIVSAAGLNIKKQFYLLDEVGDNEWRLNYTNSLFANGHSALEAMEFQLTDNNKIPAGLRLVQKYTHGHVVLLFSKVIATRAGQPRRMLHIEQDPKTLTWRMVYSPELIPDIKKLGMFKFVRPQVEQDICADPSTEDLLKMIGENTGRRINLSLDDLDQYLSVARGAIALSRKQ